MKSHFPSLVRRRSPTVSLVIFVLGAILVAMPRRSAQAVGLESFVANYCIECHHGDSPAAGLDLETLELPIGDKDRAVWERAWKRIATRQMPPPDADRPDTKLWESVAKELAHTLDQISLRSPRIPPVDRIRRLTRTEYGHAIEDLLGVAVDVHQWIPKDESSNGFDHLTVGELSPVAMSRYLTAAEKISRLAVGRARGVPTGFTVRLPPDLTQERHLEGLPLGTRGGVRFAYTFPESGTYRISVRLTRDRDEKVEGLDAPHDLDFLVDQRPIKRIRILPPDNGDFTRVDAGLTAEADMEAGPHHVSVTFPAQGESLREIKRQPFDATYNRHRHPRTQPAIFEVSVFGPVPNGSDTPANENSVATQAEISKTDGIPSRNRIFVVTPKSNLPSDQAIAAEKILRPILRRAYRRNVAAEDLIEPMRFVRAAIDPAINQASAIPIANDHSRRQAFEIGIENAIASILVNPHFLFRVESSTGTSSAPYRIGEFELASRLSFFLWSSLPDDELLDVASRGHLSDPKELQTQVERMLADPRASRLVSNFGRQWLRLRNLDSITPDLRRFPDFDENLRRAFARETELLLESVIRRDVALTALIDSPFTFMNERLATHYGYPGIRGSHFRRVDLDPDSHRGGILRHGSVLMVTSYATRTAPTIRGQFVLETLMGTPPPPPPPNVPALTEPAAGDHGGTSIRDRLARHRKDPACASCHRLMDPIGFALENYDAVGRWRVYDGDHIVDVSGELPDGRPVSGPADLESRLLAHPDQFAAAVADKLLTFALGRPTESEDAAAIRKIVSQCRNEDYRFSSLVQAIVASEPFQFRVDHQANP